MATTAAESTLANVVDDEFVRYFQHLATRVERAVRSLPREKLWVKPFAYGNSVGHLVLHLTGNLNHYVGSIIAGTGYVRDRPSEFTDPAQYPAEDVLVKFPAGRRDGGRDNPLPRRRGPSDSGIRPAARHDPAWAVARLLSPYEQPHRPDELPRSGPGA